MVFNKSDNYATITEPNFRTFSSLQKGTLIPIYPLLPILFHTCSSRQTKPHFKGNLSISIKNLNFQPCAWVIPCYRIYHIRINIKYTKIYTKITKHCYSIL